jgi:hypothetical protein
MDWPRTSTSKEVPVFSKQCSISPASNRLLYRIWIPPPPDIPPDWLAEFEAAARRPLELRMKYAFIKTYKPVMDDEKFRAFNTTKEYREWCEANLPDWLGYGRI